MVNAKNTVAASRAAGAGAGPGPATEQGSVLGLEANGAKFYTSLDEVGVEVELVMKSE